MNFVFTAFTPSVPITTFTPTVVTITNPVITVGTVTNTTNNVSIVGTTINTSNPSIGGNTNTIQTTTTGNGNIPNNVEKRGIGTIGKVICGLIIVSALRKLWNLIFKTKPKNQVSLAFENREVRNQNNSKAIRFIDAVLDIFDIGTKSGRMLKSLGNKFDKDLGGFCTILIPCTPDENDPVILQVKPDVSDFTTTDVGAFDTWKASQGFASVNTFLTAFKAKGSNNLGSLLVRCEVSDLEALQKANRNTSTSFRPYIRFNSRGDDFIADQNVIIDMSHLPESVIKSIVTDEALFRELLRSTKSGFADDKCKSDCGDLLIEVCPCYAPDVCAGYGTVAGDQASYDSDGCVCIKTQITIEVTNDYYDNRVANPGKNIAELNSLTGGNAAISQAFKMFDQSKVGALQEKYMDMYYGYKTVIVVESTSDDGTEVLVPDSYRLST